MNANDITKIAKLEEQKQFALKLAGDSKSDAMFRVRIAQASDIQRQIMRIRFPLKGG